MLDGGLNFAAGLRVSRTKMEGQHSNLLPFGCCDGECRVGRKCLMIIPVMECQHRCDLCMEWTYLAL